MCQQISLLTSSTVRCSRVCQQLIPTAPALLVQCPPWTTCHHRHLHRSMDDAKCIQKLTSIIYLTNSTASHFTWKQYCIPYSKLSLSLMLNCLTVKHVIFIRLSFCLAKCACIVYLCSFLSIIHILLKNLVFWTARRTYNYTYGLYYSQG